MKKSSIFFITLLLVLVILIPNPVMATPVINLNGQQLSFDVPPTIENGRILVPLRTIFEVMGATVEWNQDTQTVIAIKENTKVILQIGSTTPTINNQVKQLDVPAKIINGRTLAPLRFVGEAFGGFVNWDGNTQTVSISMVDNSTSTVATNLQEAMVVRVIDGDTLVINVEGEEKKVRLILVDTPESVHPDQTKNTEYGKLASAFTSEQLKIGQKVYLQKDVSETDKYNRLLRYVWLVQPTNVDDENEVRGKMYNAKLLLEGYAQIATFPPDVKYVDMFNRFVTEARNANKGLWGYEEQKIESDSNLKTEVIKTGIGTGKIKGNINSKGEKIYHVPGGMYYDKTDPEEWFETEADAQVAGYRRSKR